MADQKPWFLVMTPADANKLDSQWVRHGAVSRGKVMVLPITQEGWIMLGIFVTSLVVLPTMMWVIYFFIIPDLHIAVPILGTLLAIGLNVTWFIGLVRATMTRVPPTRPEPTVR